MLCYVMFESTAQIVESQFITIPTKIPLINYQRSSFQKKIDFDVIRNALRNTQMFNSIFLTEVKVLLKKIPFDNRMIP